MGSQEFLNICRMKVAEYFNQKKEKTDAMPIMAAEDSLQATGRHRISH